MRGRHVGHREVGDRGGRLAVVLLQGLCQIEPAGANVNGRINVFGRLLKRGLHLIGVGDPRELGHHERRGARHVRSRHGRPAQVLVVVLDAALPNEPGTQDLTSGCGDVDPVSVVGEARDVVVLVGRGHRHDRVVRPREVFGVGPIISGCKDDQATIQLISASVVDEVVDCVLHRLRKDVRVNVPPTVLRDGRTVVGGVYVRVLLRNRRGDHVPDTGPTAIIKLAVSTRRTGNAKVVVGRGGHGPRHVRPVAVEVLNGLRIAVEGLSVHGAVARVAPVPDVREQVRVIQLNARVVDTHNHASISRLGNPSALGLNVLKPVLIVVQRVIRRVDEGLRIRLLLGGHGLRSRVRTY